MGELRENNVEMIDDRLLPFPLPNSNANPTPELIAAESWVVAEIETQRIMSQFQATVVSEERRRDVIDYVQRLIRGYVGCEVFPYGSVPLKTYLPDGDIDLTAFGGTNGEDTLADDIVSVLEAEEKNRNADFVVKDVQLIRAEVKLVKCIVQNIVVDISFNQIGGLCTLCFLEQVDRLIGKDHLFKQSVILIKAWCYYESRILGAHHGLISTYALETLVLYIFHVFHSTLDGPLAVLYRFLDYFSKFDWETYCISLNGPVRISALPDLLAETPQTGSSDLLLGHDFLRYCSDMFSVPSRGADMNVRSFPQKYLNIVDPLKENNNLGRSVSKGNFYRIRSAFSFGARKLGRILMHPVDEITGELRLFFLSTLDRHGSGQRPDVQDPPPRSALSVYAKLKPENCIDTAGDCKQNHDGSGAELKEGRIQNGQQRSSIGITVLSEVENPDERRCFLGSRVTGDAKDLATSRLDGLKISNDSAKGSPPTPSDEKIVPSARMPPHAPHLYFSKSWLANGKTKNGDLDKTLLENFDDKESSARKDEVVASVGSPELNCLDLSGDYDSHFICLQYGRWCYEYALSVHSVTMPLPSPPPASFRGINFWDPVRHPSQHFKRNGFPHGNANGVIPSPVYFSVNQVLVPPVAFGSEEMPKHRGTGTYFPNPNRPQHGFRPSIVKGRNLGQARSPRTYGRSMVLAEANILDGSNLEQLPQAHFPVDQGIGTDIHQSYSPRRKLNPNANGFIPQPEPIAEVGSVEHHMPLRATIPVTSKLPKNASLRPQITSQGSPAPTIQRPRPAHDPDRLMVRKSYHLKDEDDFPPLSF